MRSIREQLKAQVRQATPAPGTPEASDARNAPPPRVPAGGNGDGLNRGDVLPLQAARDAGLDDEQLTRVLGRTLGVEWAGDLLDRPPSAEFMEKVPIGFARQWGLLGLATDNGCMPVAVRDVAGLRQLDVLSRHLNRRLKPLFASAGQIQAAINAAYQQRTGQAQTFLDQIDRDEVLRDIHSLSQVAGGGEDLLDVATRAPVIKLVNLMLFEAVKLEASDVHVQPYEERIIVRMRIDGVLFDAFEVPKAMQDEVVSRVKVMAKMNIAEKRLAQDGRATVQVGDRVIDLRIASMPTSFGERVVIRLLDKSARLYTLGELGMDGTTLERFRELIGVEHGLILVTGPTGSGKSTTLYAALQEINSKQRNILTLEDPIEYQLPGVSQTQVNTRKGMTFASGLRSVLRQDPDIIMVGEIRDHETAVMAIQSALTGHLVFSTLHTNDAASAVTRLLDLGIEPYLVASSVVGVLAQRLVRRICPTCARPRKPEPPPPETGTVRGTQGAGLEGQDSTNRHQGVGCDVCRNTGYRGRVGIFELLTVNDSVRQHINQRSTASQIKQVAIEHGMQTLRDQGVTKMNQGVTTMDEVLRVTMRATF